MAAYGDRMLQQAGSRFRMVTGSIPTSAGCGFPTSLSAGLSITTAAGFGRRTKAGYGYQATVAGHRRPWTGFSTVTMCVGRPLGRGELSGIVPGRRQPQRVDGCGSGKLHPGQCRTTENCWCKPPSGKPTGRGHADRAPGLQEIESLTHQPVATVNVSRQAVRLGAARFTRCRSRNPRRSGLRNTGARLKGMCLHAPVKLNIDSEVSAVGLKNLSNLPEREESQICGGIELRSSRNPMFSARFDAGNVRGRSS